MSKENERIKAVLEVEPVDFPGTTESAYMSTITLSKYVNSIFRNAFKDYVGCKIYPIFNDAYTMRHPVRCDLIFSLGSDNLTGAKLAAFKPVADPVKAQVGTRANYTDIISSHNARIRNLNCAEITQDAIDIFHPLLWNELAKTTAENSKAYQDKGIVKEQSTSVPYSATTEIVTPVISFIDIASIWKVLCSPAKDDKDEYMVTPIRSIAAMSPAIQQQAYYNGQATENYLYQISKINRDDFMDLMNEVGYVSRTGNVDCFTDSF